MKLDEPSMTSNDLGAFLSDRGALGVTTKADYGNSISTGVVRGVLDGRLVAGVGANHPSPISAFTDLIDLHLRGWAPPGAEVTVDDEVDFYLAPRPGDLETPAALRTLAAGVQGVRARVFLVTPDGTPQLLEEGPTDFSDAIQHNYTNWLGLLDDVPDEPPPLVTRLIVDTGIPALRAYPMLSSRGRSWSIRLEGLQVGVLRAKNGTLTVGEERPSARRSGKRQAWLNTAGPDPIPVTESSVGAAAQVLARFAEEWPKAADPIAPVQDEHALESRILRGAAPLTPKAGRSLTLLNPRGNRTVTPDPVVNWGSQFPTRWGPRTGAARYLDGLLRDGSAPWAIEMKVRGGQGVGQYYRHAIHQAVLYRQFIRTATPLAPWFERQGLVQADCQAAVVTPEGQGRVAEQINRARQVAEAFGVELITVEDRYAHLHPGDLG